MPKPSLIFESFTIHKQIYSKSCDIKIPWQRQQVWGKMFKYAPSGCENEKKLSNTALK